MSSRRARANRNVMKPDYPVSSSDDDSSEEEEDWTDNDNMRAHSQPRRAKKPRAKTNPRATIPPKRKTTADDSQNEENEKPRAKKPRFNKQGTSTDTVGSPEKKARKGTGQPKDDRDPEDVDANALDEGVYVGKDGHLYRRRKPRGGPKEDVREGPWTPTETLLLLAGLRKHGIGKHSEIAKDIPSR